MPFWVLCGSDIRWGSMVGQCLGGSEVAKKPTTPKRCSGWRVNECGILCSVWFQFKAVLTAKGRKGRKSCD